MIRMFMVSLLLAASNLAQQGIEGPKFDAPQTPQSRTRFEGKLSIQTGGPVVRVALKDWVIRNRQQVSLPEKGMLVIEMRSGGKATTVINGQRTERKDGDYFTVPQGATTSVETENDTVVFTILAIEP